MLLSLNHATKIIGECSINQVLPDLYIHSYMYTDMYMYSDSILIPAVYYICSRLTDPLFIAALKITMSILHKGQSVVHRLLSGESTFQFTSDNTGVQVTWPAECMDESTGVKVQWVKRVLHRQMDVCEEILKKGQRIVIKQWGYMYIHVACVQGI